jgi:23S rRNA pseudouridine1911/1915/1917 synthase
LHAGKLGFDHPRTQQEMVFEAPLPDIFQKTLEKLDKKENFK